MGWTVFARRANRSIAGKLKGWSLDLTLRFNEVGSWSLKMPRELCPAGWPEAGCGIVVASDGVIRASGMVDEEAFDWAASDDSEFAGPGLWSLSGDTDLARIAYRIIYPNPASSWSAQTVAAHFAATGNAEVLLRNLVNTQAGPAALQPRREPGVILGPVAGVGVNTSVRERFTPMLDVLRSVALAGGGLGFDMVDDMTGVLPFTVYQPADKTRTARFSVPLGNVTELHAARRSPAGTVALVAGSGQLTARQTLEQSDPAANPEYGRRELFLDQRQTTDTAEYVKAALEALDSNAQQSRVSAELVDTEVTKWGRDYNLGDRISVDTEIGVISDLARAVRIVVDATGDEQRASTVGTTEATTDDQMARIVNQLLRRISHLERNV